MPPPAETADRSTRPTCEAVAAGEPRVVVRPQGGSYRIDVFDRDRLGLFADTAGLLAAYGLVVRTAILRTVDGVAANEWHVESPSGEPPARGAHRARAGAARARATARRSDCSSGAASSRARPSAESGIGLARPGPRPGGAARLRARRPCIEVRAQDRPGLLHELGHRRSPRPASSVRSAHIATYAGQTLDTFYVTEFGGRLLSPAKVAQTVAMVIDTCDGADRPT